MPVDLSDLLKGGPGHDGYTFRADVYCVECGQLIIRSLWADGELPDTPEACGDSDACPVPVFFGESDTPTHCANCQRYLYGRFPYDPHESDWFDEEYQRAQEADVYDQPEWINSLCDDDDAADLEDDEDWDFGGEG